MRLLSLGSGLGAVLLSITAASAQIPQTQGSNILMTRCDAKPFSVSEPAFHASPAKSGFWEIVALQYQNEAPIAATEVAFALVSAGKALASGEDRGTFARGATIDHQLTLSQDSPLPAQTHCIVLGVRYANGAVWNNPAPPPLALNP